MSKPSIIPNWKYQKPSKGGYKGLKKLLKYVSYRESPDHRPVDLSDRWTDCGLGGGWRGSLARNSKSVWESDRRGSTNEPGRRSRLVQSIAATAAGGRMLRSSPAACAGCSKAALKSA